MKLSTQRAMTKAVAYAVGVRGGPLLEAMLRGVEEPDRNPEEELQARVSRRGNVYFVRRRVRHHTAGNQGRIMKRLWAARKCWLKDRPVEAAWHLGYALHYIQDAAVEARNHEAEEAEMRSAPIPLKTIDAAVEAAKPSPNFLRQVFLSLAPSPGALALENASAASAFAAAAVFAPRDPPSSLVEAVEAKKPGHFKLMALAAVSAIAGLATIAVAPAAALVAFAVAAASYAADGGYRRLREELKWFRLS